MLCCPQQHRKEVALHAQILLKTLIFLPETANHCLGALQALLMMHAQERTDFIKSAGAAKLCTILGERALGERAIQRGMELLCTLCWQLRRNSEGMASRLLQLYISLLNCLVFMTLPSTDMQCCWYTWYAGDLEAVLLEGAKRMHLNACSCLTEFAAISVLSEHALKQATVQLLSLL
jgi:hypothetical protein